MRMIKSMLCALLIAISSLAFAAPVNINTADAGTLESLAGVGPARAAAIINDRERNGPFQTIDDLGRVDGIGSQTIENNRDNMTVGAK